MPKNVVPRPNEHMPDPLAYFLTWTTYGTWLPGDERGWVLSGKGFQFPNPVTKKFAGERMTESINLLDTAQREVVELTIEAHCRIRNWALRAIACRSNHVHVVVTAPVQIENARDQFKAWCTRRLKEHTDSCRTKWWTEGGSCRYIGDDESLETVFKYVMECQ